MMMKARVTNEKTMEKRSCLSWGFYKSIETPSIPHVHVDLKVCERKPEILGTF